MDLEIPVIYIIGLLNISLSDLENIELFKHYNILVYAILVNSGLWSLYWTVTIDSEKIHNNSNNNKQNNNKKNNKSLRFFKCLMSVPLSHPRILTYLDYQKKWKMDLGNFASDHLNDWKYFL